MQDHDGLGDGQTESGRTRRVGTRSVCPIEAIKQMRDMLGRYTWSRIDDTYSHTICSCLAMQKNSAVSYTHLTLPTTPYV